MIARLRRQELYYRWRRLTAAFLEFTVRNLSYTLADQIALRLSFDNHREMYEGDEHWSD